MGGGEACMFVAVDAGPMVACDGWTFRSCGGAACEEYARDGSGIGGGGVGSGDCDLDSLERKRPPSLKGISIQDFATMQLEKRAIYPREGVRSFVLRPGASKERQ